MDGLFLVDFELREEIGEECNATQSASLMLYSGMEAHELQNMLAAVFAIPNPTAIAAIQVQPEGHVIPLSFLSLNPSAFSSSDKYQTLQLLITRAPPRTDHQLSFTKLADPMPEPHYQPTPDTGRITQSAATESSLMAFLSSLVSSPVPLINAAEQIALKARVECDDREIFNWYDSYQQEGDMLLFVRRLLIAAQNDLSSLPPPCLELTLARIWILKEMSLISQEECLALQDLARDQDSLVVTVFAIYGGNDVDERVLAAKLLDAARSSNLVESDFERDRQRLLKFRLQTIRDLFDAELLDDSEAEAIELAIAQTHPVIEQAFTEFALTGDSGKLAQTITGDLNQDKVEDSETTDWLVARLTDTHGLSDHWARSLKQLIAEGDEVVMAAIEAFNHDGDWAELIETLDAVLIHNSAERKHSIRAANDQLHDKVSPLTSKERRHLCQLTDDLYKEARVDDSHWASLKALVLRKDPIAEAAYSVYGICNDWEDFIDTAQRLACRTHARPSHVGRGPTYEHILNNLVSSGKIGPATADRIMTAAKGQDDSVMAIIEQYDSDANVQELTDNFVEMGKSI